MSSLCRLGYFKVHIPICNLLQVPNWTVNVYLCIHIMLIILLLSRKRAATWKVASVILHCHQVERSQGNWSRNRCKHVPLDNRHLQQQNKEIILMLLKWWKNKDELKCHGTNTYWNLIDIYKGQSNDPQVVIDRAKALKLSLTLYSIPQTGNWGEDTQD